MVSSTLLSSVGVTHMCTDYLTWNSDESNVEEIKGVTTAVDDVKTPTL